MNTIALRRQWALLAALNVSVILHAVLYAAQPGKGDSRSFWLLAGMLGGLALFTLIAAALLNPPRLAALRRIPSWLGPVYALGAAAAAFGFGLLMRPEWFYAHAALALALTLALIYRTLFDGSHPLTGRARLGVLLIVLVVVIIAGGLRVAALSTFPSLHEADEPWVLSWSIHVLETGRTGDPMIPGRQLALNSYPYLLAGWLKLAGVGLWQARLFNWLLSGVLIVFSALAGWRLFSPRTGWLTGGAMFAGAIVASAARIRHDVGLAVMIALALWLYGEAITRQRRSLHAAAGLAMGLGLFAHYNASGLGVALLVALYGPDILARLRERRLPDAPAWAFGIGGLAGALIVIAIQLLPDFDEFLDLYAPDGGSSASPLEAYWHYAVAALWGNARYEFLLIALGFGAALWRGRPADWRLVRLLLIAPLALAIITPGLNVLYVVHLAPVYGLAVGSLLGEGLARQARTRPSPAPQMSPAALVTAALILLPLLAYTLAEPLEHVRERRPRDLPPPFAAQWALDHLPETATIVGPHYYYLWLHDYHYLSPRIPFEPLEGALAAYDSEPAIWDALDVDAFLIDPDQSSSLTLEQLRDTGYFTERGYERIAGPGQVAIYHQPTPAAGP